MGDSEKKFENFVGIVKELRSPQGCPWDRKQNPQSLKRYLEEETLELLEAIDEDDQQHVKEELGDLLYIIVLLAQIHSEKDFFGINDVLDGISAKMTRRHPHVFSNDKIETSAELRKKWLEIKNREKTGGSVSKKN